MTTALLCLDLINDYVAPDGKLTTPYMQEHSAEILERISRVQGHFRSPERMVIHVGTWFTPGYAELAPHSKLYAEVKAKEALIAKEYGASFVDTTAPQSTDPKMHKHRSSAFFRSRLEIVLRAQQVDTLYIVGADTAGSIESTVRAAHDGDFNVIVLADCCIGRDEAEHQAALEAMNRFAEVVNFTDISARLATA